MSLKPLKIGQLPKSPQLLKLIGPSFILLGLGLGSGELILWPHLTSKYGLGIIWGALVGITFQFFINMEIERYALITGESVFVGLARKLGRVSPLWFIFSTLIPWMWPGIVASSALVITHILGINYSPIYPIILLLLIGMILTLGPVIYKTQEIFQKSLIIIGVPFIILLTIYISRLNDWISLSKGLVGIGDGYFFFPLGISLATFLGAFAYAGAGGNLNLVQSFYIKEKGYGMGKYSGRITSILTGKKEKIELTGTTFEITNTNLMLFKSWWKKINIEHFLIFWLTGLTTMIFLSILSFITTYQKGITSQGIEFLLHEAGSIGSLTLPIIATVFMVIVALMLFSTQFSVLDATSRIMSENLIISSQKHFKIEKLPIYYYIFLWAQIVLGIIIFASGFNEPLKLVITGAVLNAFTMFVYSGLLIWLNNKSLQKPLRPSIFRNSMVFTAFVFYGVFCGYTILQYLK